MRLLRAGIAAFGLALGLAGAGPHAQASDLPSMGDPASQGLSPLEEQRLGEAIMRKARQQLRLVDDPEVRQYVEDLGQRIVAASDEPAQSFEFFVIVNPSINAFALPGGFIGVHTGLLEAAESESELAAVLAHEVAHVTQRHIARAYNQSGKRDLVTAAAIIAAVILGSQDPELGRAAASAGLAASAQSQLNFTRANEREADRLGIGTLARAGFEPEAMARFFERLERERRLYGNRVPEFLSTHPVTVSRVSEARSRADQLTVRDPRESDRFRLVRHKLTILHAEDPHRMVERFKAKRDEAPTPQARYGYALALQADGQPGQALAVLEALVKQSEGETIPYQIAYARALAADGQVDRAKAVYEDALTLYPGNYPLTVGYARMLLRHNNPAKARDLLRGYTRRHQADAMVYELLAQAAGDAGHSVQAHEAMAEYYYRVGQYEAAVAQLELALRMADEYYQTSRLEARLAQLRHETELAQQIEEELGL